MAAPFTAIAFSRTDLRRGQGPDGGWSRIFPAKAAARRLSGAILIEWTVRRGNTFWNLCAVCDDAGIMPTARHR